MTAWKDLERTVAKAFGGIRIPRGEDYSSSLPDVIVDLTNKVKSIMNPAKVPIIGTIECKYRTNSTYIDIYKKIFKQNNSPILCIIQTMSSSAMYFFELEDFVNRMLNPVGGPITSVGIDKKCPKYLSDFWNQAREYAVDTDTRKKIRNKYLEKTDKYIEFQHYIPLIVLGKRNDPTRIVGTNSEYIKYFM